MTMSYAILAVGILIGVGGQMLLKSGASGTLLQQLLSPHTIAGLALYVGAAFCYMYAVRKVPVSVAFPSVSLSYVVVAVAAHWLHDEPLTLMKFGGIALICAGVFMVTRTA